MILAAESLTLEWSIFTAYLMICSVLMLYGGHCYKLIYMFIRRNSKVRKQINQQVDAFTKSCLEEDLPHVTIQLPTYNEREVIARIIKTAVEVDYPKDRLEIQVVDDSTDDSVQIIDDCVRKWRAEGFDITAVRRVERKGFKAGALKYANTVAKGEFLAIFDSDFLIPKGFLRRSIAQIFRQDKVACIQGRWGHLNENENWLTQVQAVSLNAHFSASQGARSYYDLCMNFNGTGGIWRKCAIDEAGGWQGDTLTEDMDLSYRVQMLGYEIVYDFDLECPAELPNDIIAFKSQQHRWSKGGTETALKLLPDIFKSGTLNKHQKIESFMHLSHNVAPIFMIILCILTLPMLLVVPKLTLSASLGLVWGMIIFCSLGPCAMYAGSGFVMKKGFFTLSHIPHMMAMGTGLCVNNALAAIEALMGHKTDFIRTPKSGSEGKKKKKMKYKVNSSLGVAITEIILGLYSLATFIVFLHQAKYFFGFFIASYAYGFLYFGLKTMAHIFQVSDWPIVVAFTQEGAIGRRAVAAKAVYHRQRRVWHPILVLSAIASGIWCYSSIASSWTNYLPSMSLFLFEIPVFAVIVFILSFRVRYRKWYTRMLSFAPYALLITLYVYFDLFCAKVSRAPRFSDWQILTSFWDSKLLLVASLPLLCLGVAVAFNFVNYVKQIATENVYRRVSVRMAGLIALLFFVSNGEIMAEYVGHLMKFDNGSEFINIQKNGRLSSMCYYNVQSHKNKMLLKSLPYKFDHVLDKKSELTHPRNIHVLMLDTLFDPALCQNVTFNQSPIHPALLKYLPNHKSFSTTDVPATSGVTAQAEFELLCGVPALAKVGPIEFSSLPGKPTYSLCQPFNDNGYQTTCTRAPGSQFAHNDLAYKSLRFSHVVFNKVTRLKPAPTKLPQPIVKKGLLAKNLDFVTSELKKGKPIFNYVSGVNRIVTGTKPDVIIPSYSARKDKVSAKLVRASNKLYYQTEAIAKYLDALTALDKNALILVCACKASKINLPKEKHVVTAKPMAVARKNVPYLFIDAGNVVRKQVTHLHNFHQEILTRLGSDNMNAKLTPANMEARYYAIIAMANGYRKKAKPTKARRLTTSSPKLELDPLSLRH